MELAALPLYPHFSHLQPSAVCRTSHAKAPLAQRCTCRQDLHSFLDEYKQQAALSVHWIWVGPNGHASRPATGGVLPYYTLCSSVADPHIKTIVNTFFLESLAVHPHNFHYRCVLQCG